MENSLKLCKTAHSVHEKNLIIWYDDRIKELLITTRMSQKSFAELCRLLCSHMIRIEYDGFNAPLDVIEILTNIGY